MKTTPSQWARANRRYTAADGRPGPRDPSVTPYVVPFCDAIHDPDADKIVFVCPSQMGKTEALLDLIGHGLETMPKPMIFFAPSENFVVDILEPPVQAMLEAVPALARMIQHGKRMKITRKLVGGVALRLGWAGSASQMSSSPAAIVFLDEIDRMVTDVEGEGNPLILAEARTVTYRDRKIVVTSTPKIGAPEIVRDDETGLEFWGNDADQLASPIWRQFQEGSRHHWTWLCPECGERFVPRFKCLRWEKDATPERARATAFIECPRSGCVLGEQHKQTMNAGGEYVAPSARPQTSAKTFWVSGLANPFKSIGELAEAHVRALQSGEKEMLQAVMNTAFGELFPDEAGDAPELQQIEDKCAASKYVMGDVPAGVVRIGLAADIQLDRIYYVIRGFGPQKTSWMLRAGVLYGETNESAVWQELQQILDTPIGGHLIKKALIDMGYRTEQVKKFCASFPGNRVLPSKGSSRDDGPAYKFTKMERNRKNKLIGARLMLLNASVNKLAVHERISWPASQPGAWHLPKDAPGYYCAQLRAEKSRRNERGRLIWSGSRENHCLDCESQLIAIGDMLRSEIAYHVSVNGEPINTATPKPVPKPVPAPKPVAAPKEKPQPRAAPRDPFRTLNRSRVEGFLPRRSIWDSGW